MYLFTTLSYWKIHFQFMKLKIVDLLVLIFKISLSLLHCIHIKMASYTESTCNFQWHGVGGPIMMRGTSIAMHANNVLQTPCNLLFPQTHCQVRVLSPGSWLHIQHSYMNTHEHSWTLRSSHTLFTATPPRISAGSTVYCQHLIMRVQVITVQSSPLVNAWAIGSSPLTPPPPPPPPPSVSSDHPSAGAYPSETWLLVEQF